MKKLLFFACLLLFILPIAAFAQIGHIFNAYFEVGKVDVLTNDTIQIKVEKWGGMMTPQGVASYDQTDIQSGFIVWYFCDRYEVVANDGIRLKMLPLNGPYDNPVESGYRVWVVNELASEGGNIVAPDPPVFEPNFYGIYLQSYNCISAYYATRNAWSAEAGLSYDFRNLSVNTSGGLVIYNDSVQIEPRGIHGYMINQMSATTGQALAWNGSNWQPATIAGGGGSTFTSLNVGAVGDQNNWSPSGATSLTRHLKIQPQAGVTTITGIVPLASGNYTLQIENNGQYYATFTHEDAASSAANRLSLDAPFVTLRPGGLLTLMYDASASRWEVVSNSSPRKTRYTNEVYGAQRISFSPTTTDNFAFTSSGGSASGTGATSTMQVPYGNITTSSSATGRYAYHANTIAYFSDKGEISYFRATVQPNAAAPDGTENYLIAAGYVGSTDISTSPKTAAFVLGAVGSTYCGYTFLNSNWHCITYDGVGSAEVFDTGITPAYSSTVNSTNLRELTVSMTESGVKYWVDGTVVATHATETVINAPLTAGVAIDKTLGTTSRSCAVAYLEYYFNDNF